MRIAAATSKTECCFKNTVDTEIKIAAAVNAIRQPAELKCLLCQEQSITAADPNTWIEGNTLVLVSNR